MRHRSAKLTFLIFILTFIAWGALVYYFGSEQIVEMIGVENGYLITFLIALFGGMSSFTGSTYVATLITFANGGLDPLLLALCATAGVSIGDTVYFILARRGSLLLTRRNTLKQKIDKLRAWLEQKPAWLIWISVYLYTSFTPLPNDVLTIALGLTRQPYLLVITALTFGAFTLSFVIMQFGQLLPF